jgi:hypothetical protein
MGTSTALRAWMGLGVAIGVLASGQVFAQMAAEDAAADWRPAGARLGLNPDKVQLSIGCGSSLLPCQNQAQAFASHAADSLRWSVELGAPASGLASGRGLPAARQGLDLSLVGRKPLFGSSFSVYGKLGTTYGTIDPTFAAASGAGVGDSGYGLLFGAGVSMDVTSRLSASFGFDSRDLRLGTTGPRDQVRSTSLGLQYRY